MREKDVELLEGMFRRYYFERAGDIGAPHQIRQREFGYQRWNGGMVRHQKLRDGGELRAKLLSLSPSDAYSSCAYYDFPDLPMNEKGWKGADLIFDIDAKDLRLDCRSGHTAQACGECAAASADGAGCPACGSARLRPVSLACGRCVEGSKKEVGKLLGILTDDLGVPRGDIRIYFSGNEGFHVHARAAKFEQLDSRERGELADYIRFRGAVPERFGMTRRQQKKTLRDTLPELGAAGWAGRVAKELFRSKAGRARFISEAGPDSYDLYGEKLKGISGTIGAMIDSQVTADVRRVFRLPGSLNGKSGMAKVRCDDIGSFDPYVDACVLDDRPVEVTASCPVRLKLRGRRFGPYVRERVEVPGYAAAYMICKGVATSEGPAR